jgi:hypothetical protein
MGNNLSAEVEALAVYSPMSPSQRPRSPRQSPGESTVEHDDAARRVLADVHE